jgi:hypothetical protein
MAFPVGRAAIPIGAVLASAQAISNCAAHSAKTLLRPFFRNQFGTAQNEFCVSTGVEW